MYIKKMHILIEQKLQNIGVFAYSDFQKEEVDLQIDTAVVKLIEDQFTTDGASKTKFEDNQKNKDKLKELEVRNYNVSFDKVEDEYIGNLPEDYYHLISDKSHFLYKCFTKPIATGEIEADKYYLIVSGTITYNGNSYTKGSYFKGVSEISSYGFTGEKPVIYQLALEKKANHLTQLEYYDTTIDNALTTSNLDGLVSTISDKKLIVFSPDFFVDKIFITYIKRPNNANFNFKQLSNLDTLIIGKEYEVVSGTVIYNGVSYTYSGYNKLNSFIAITGHLEFTGTGKVRVKTDGDLELNDITCYLIVDEVAKSLAILSEQNQQKIVNMTQNGIPS